MGIINNTIPKGILVGGSTTYFGTKENGLFSFGNKSIQIGSINNYASTPLGYGIKGVLYAIKEGGLGSSDYIVISTQSDIDAFGYIDISETISITTLSEIIALTSVTAQLDINISTQWEILATGLMGGILFIGDRPSAEDIAQAVWGSLAAGLNTAGTMGELLNSAGAGGNPWVANIEGTYTAGDILKIMVAVLAGKTNIAGNTVTFRDINDTTDRVEATMTDSERTTVNITV